MSKILLERIDKLIWWGILSFVFFSPISISLAQISFLFALLFWLIKLFSTKHWQRTPLDLPIILFLFIGLVCSVLGFNPQHSFRELSSEILLFMIFFLVVNNLDYPKAQKLIRLLFIVVALTAFYGVVKFFVVHEERLSSTKWYMTYGGYIMIAMLFFLPSLLISKEVNTKRYLHWTAFVLMFAALVLTFTRGAWIGFIIGCFFILWHYKRRWIKGFILCLIAVVFCTFLLFPRAKLTRRINQIIEVDSWGGRPEMWLVALKIIHDRPLFGVGLDNYRYTVQKYLPEEDPKTTSFCHAHNHYLHIASERGLIGLGTFLFIWYTIFILAYRIYRNTNEVDIHSVVLGIMGALVGFLTEGLSENIYGDSEVRMLIWFLVSLLFVFGRTQRIETNVKN